MKGTEKQIAWATDIINHPAEVIQKYAAELAVSPIAKDRAASESFAKAVEMYHEMLAKVPKINDACFVIDNRRRFTAIAEESVRRCLLADGIHPSNYLLNLASKF